MNVPVYIITYCPIFVVIISEICKRCKERLADLLTDFSVETIPDPSGVEEASFDVPAVVVPGETKSFESSEQETEERV